MPEPEIIFLDEVDSTNRYALEYFDKLPDGAMVSANSQTAGRGRLNRHWESPPGENIYATFVMKNLPEHKWQYATMAISLGVLDLLRNYAPEVDPWLKWPNDVYCGHRKICGMFGEIKTSANNQPVGVAAGVGININMPPARLIEIDQPATSLFAETNRIFNVRNLCHELAIFVKGYYSISFSNPHKLYELWYQENRLIGKTITMEVGDHKFVGKVSGFGKNGEIIFESSGKEMRFHSGDVRIDKDSLKNVNN
ncbi:MAG: biotin--[acetyl-CoA-carboxylase] ligase [Victivallaceae bacterium]|nr:biotin--[acetyl-CoA-carboxylase] ligase [Victivallaceae bacterium]